MRRCPTALALASALVAWLAAALVSVSGQQTATIEITSFPMLNDPNGVIAGRVAGLTNPAQYQATLALESAYASVWSSVTPKPLSAQGEFSFGGGADTSGGVYFRNAKINIAPLSSAVPKVLNEPFPVSLDAVSVAIGLYPRDYAEPAAAPGPTATPPAEFTQPGGPPGISQPGGGDTGEKKDSKLGMIIGLSVGGAAIALIALVVAGVVLTRRYSKVVRGRVMADSSSIRQTDDQELLAQTANPGVAASPMSSPSDVAGSGSGSSSGGGGSGSDNLTGRGRTLTGSLVGEASSASGIAAGEGVSSAVAASPLTSPPSRPARRSLASRATPTHGGATGTINSDHAPPARSVIQQIERSSSGRPLFSPSAGSSRRLPGR